MEKNLLDGDGQPRSGGFNWSNNEIKAVNTLYGLCMGILADGKVDDNEILFLDIWLKDHVDYLDNYPLNVVYERIQRILTDDISQNDRDDFYLMLGKLVGGTIEETGAASGGATKLPVDEIVSIDFNSAVFCFTGKFIYGQRSACEKVVIDLGATVVKGVTKKVSHLVIGELASRDWVASSHGRKIEKALLYKQQGVQVFILSEEEWLKHV